MTTKTKLFTPALAVAFTGLAFGQADECSAATDVGTGNSNTAFDTNNCVDTMAPATTSAEQQCFSLSNDVWFKYTASMTGLAQIDTCNTATFDTEIGVWEGADCASMVALGCNDDNGAAGCSGLTSLITVNVTAGQTYYVQVGYWSSSGSTWGTGTLNITEMMDPCAALGDDAFEDNDDCASATPLGDGNYPGLIIQNIDNDLFEVGLDDGATLTVDIFFLHAEMDMDLYLWDPNIACGTDVVGEGTTTGALAVGFSASDNEQVVYTNTTGAAQTLVVEVTRWDGNSAGCATYDMDIAGSNGMGGQLGSNYCMANANSTGAIATISAAGSAVAANNDVTITATDLPQNAFGFFLVSDTQGFVPNPGGSEGNLCLGGGIGRYVGPGQIMNAGAAGEISLVLDISVIPRPMGNASAMAGDTWNWTTWYRDMVGGLSTSNFTNGLTITFI